METIKFAYRPKLIILTLLAIIPPAPGQTVTRNPAEGPLPVNWRTNFYCGVNCLYVALRMEGRPVDYEELCRSAAVGEKGTSLGELARLAKSHGTNYTPVRDLARSIAGWPVPAIVHQQRPDDLMGHYVLYLGRRGDLDAVLDCTTGQIDMLSRGDFLDRWTGYVLLRAEPFPLTSQLAMAGWSFLGLIVFCFGLRCLARRAPESKEEPHRPITVAN